MVAALGEFEIAGVTTNLAFLELLMSHPQVARGEIDTGFIEREISALTLAGPSVAPLDLAAACVAVLAARGARAGPAERAFAVGPDGRLDDRRPPQPPLELPLRRAAV